MAAFVFPDNPTIGQIVAGPGGEYEWDGVKWIVVGGASSSHWLPVNNPDFTGAMRGRASGTLTLDGALTVGGNSIFNGNTVFFQRVTLGTGPTAGGDAVNLNYLQGNYLPLSGGVLTGALVLSGDAYNPTQPTTLRQVQEMIAEGGGTGVGGPFLELAGGTMTGPLTLNADAAQPLQAVPLQQLEAAIAEIEIGEGGGATVGPTAPGSPGEGDLWFDSGTGELMVWDGTQWVVVGGAGGFTPPLSIADGGTSGTTASAARAYENLSVAYVGSGPNEPAWAPGGFAPMGYKVGDLFFDTTTGRLLTLTFNNGPWMATSTATTIPYASFGNGDLWYDTASRQLKVARGTANSWSACNTAVMNTAPITPAAGDFWFDTTAGQGLKVYNGSAWEVVGGGGGGGGGPWAPETNPSGGQNNYAPFTSPIFYTSLGVNTFSGNLFAVSASQITGYVPLILSGDATAALGATTLQQVEALVAAGGGGGGGGAYLPLAGGAMNNGAQVTWNSATGSFGNQSILLLGNGNIVVGSLTVNGNTGGSFSWWSNAVYSGGSTPTPTATNLCGIEFQGSNMLFFSNINQTVGTPLPMGMGGSQFSITNTGPRIGGGTTATLPSASQTGTLRYNTTVNRLQMWNGSAWVFFTTTAT